MKKLILLVLLLVACGTYSQTKVYNVQHYCIDEKPFNAGQCDISGNEYSFVFVDLKKGEVKFFLTQMKFEYQIIATKKEAAHTLYTLKNEVGTVGMKVNNEQTKIEFLAPNRNIYLTVGKSTKAAPEL